MSRFLLVSLIVLGTTSVSCREIIPALLPDPAGITRTRTEGGWVVKDTAGPGYVVGSASDITDWSPKTTCRYPRTAPVAGAKRAIVCVGPSEVKIINGGDSIGLERLPESPSI
jgi:hypothetical protein